MANILIVSAHPRLEEDSVANKTIVEELSKLLPSAEVDRLDELYPDYVIDVSAEQAKLRNADVIVLQYPLWWYGWPALAQKWVEDVFVRGFSHGSTGNALRGKKLVVSLTGMEYVGALCLYGVSYANRSDEALLADMVSRSREHAARVAELVTSL